MRDRIANVFRSPAAAGVVLGLLLVWLAGPWVLSPLVALGVRSAAKARGLDARWTQCRFRWPLVVELDGLTLTRAAEPQPVVRASRVQVALGARGFSLRPRIRRLLLADARVALAAHAADEDTTFEREDEPERGPVAPRVRAAAVELADLLLLPARRLPELRLTDLDLVRGDSSLARLDALSLTHGAGGEQLAATGRWGGERPVPFDVVMNWAPDDRLVGRADFRVPDATRGPVRLGFTVDGRVHQDRRAGRLEILEGTRVRMGVVDMRVHGEADRLGPRFRMSLELDGLTAKALERSLPPAVLGPLVHMTVLGSWDWHASADVNLAEPDSARFTANVVPHGLAIGATDAKLPLARLQEPFVAEIHVPSGVVTRELSSANPHYRPLERISPLLRGALLTNEDGGFYQHRGFNREAIQLAVAADLRSGTFRRGAGTVTMQLVRNLFLGHQRTLSRKAQEVILAWVLEHLSGLSKDRMLEIYLNVIEWGPGIHGADEAARFYFDTDAADLTLDQALLLTVLVPSPSHWKNRFDANGELRPWARSQMAYIARKMVTRGWLAPEQVPAPEALFVRLRGAAAQAFPPRPADHAGEEIRI